MGLAVFEDVPVHNMATFRMIVTSERQQQRLLITVMWMLGDGTPTIHFYLVLDKSWQTKWRKITVRLPGEKPGHSSYEPLKTQTKATQASLDTRATSIECVSLAFVEHPKSSKFELIFLFYMNDLCPVSERMAVDEILLSWSVMEYLASGGAPRQANKCFVPRDWGLFWPQSFETYKI